MSSKKFKKNTGGLEEEEDVSMKSSSSSSAKSGSLDDDENSIKFIEFYFPPCPKPNGNGYPGDDRTYKIPFEMACQSNFVADFYKNLNANETKSQIEESNTARFPITGGNITYELFGFLVEYMQYHFHNPAPAIEHPLKSLNLFECGVAKWDVDFVDKLWIGAGTESNPDKYWLYVTLAAANKFNIPSLIHLLCTAHSRKIKGRDLSKIREILDFDHAKMQQCHPYWVVKKLEPSKSESSSATSSSYSSSSSSSP